VPETRTGDEQQAAATGTPEASGTGSSAGASGSAEAGTSATGSTGMSTPTEVQGRVALVDKETREIAVDAGGATTQLKVAEDAQITINGDKASLEDLKQGQEIRATMNQGGETPEATRIEATSKAKE
jgi:hypothetical protein